MIYYYYYCYMSSQVVYIAKCCFTFVAFENIFLNVHVVKYLFELLGREYVFSHLTTVSCCDSLNPFAWLHILWNMIPFLTH